MFGLCSLFSGFLLCNRARNAEARLARAEEEERGLHAVAEASLEAWTDRLEV